MTPKTAATAIVILLVLTGINLTRPSRTPPKPQPPLRTPSETLKPPPASITPLEPAKPQRAEPTWTNYPALRARPSGLGDVLADIESHMPAGHIYRDSDKVTWAHETSHGIASNLRQQFGQGRQNGFYCLNDRAVIINEPPTTIQRAAQAVPSSLRGGVFQLYLISQAGSWGDTPLYLCDEWMGYTNGTAAGLDLAEQGLWGDEKRLGTVAYMTEFNVYVIAMLSTIPQHEDEQLKKFVMWNLERSVGLLQKSKQYPAFSDVSAETYWLAFQTGADYEQLRAFARSYFGAEWCRTALGF